MERIPIAGPSITQKEIDYVTDAATNAWYGNANVYHERFERAFADYVGRKYAIALPSCTSALHLSLLSLGIGPGDEVIVPDITWIATAAPIGYVGATPVFVDVDAASWCLSVESVEANISAKTKAIIVVDLYGNMPEMDAILEAAEKRGIPVIEDAAEAIGSEYKGKKAGSFGVTSTFSFHGSKTLTTGEGGMLLTDDDAVHARCQFLRDHGRPAGDRFFYNTEVAFKYKMSSMQAAMGLGQLERIDELVGQKRSLFSWYRDALRNCEGITLNSESENVKNTYWMVTAIVDSKYGLDKTELMAQLGESNIDARPFFHPLSSLPAYKDLANAEAARNHNINSYAVSPYGINLPSAFCVTEAQAEFVADRMQDILAGKKSPGKGEKVANDDI